MKKGTLAVRILGGVLAVAALGWFAHANSGQSVDLNFGVFTLDGVSLPVVMYGSVIIGMLIVLGVSLKGDLRTRQALKRYDQIGANAMSDIDSPDRSVLEEAEKK
jgi:uncharacterized integral membrane protein